MLKDNDVLTRVLIGFLTLAPLSAAAGERSPQELDRSIKAAIYEGRHADAEPIILKLLNLIETNGVANTPVHAEYLTLLADTVVEHDANLARAEPRLVKAYTIFEAQNRLADAAHCQTKLGFVCRKLRRLADARKHYEKALKRFKDLIVNPAIGIPKSAIPRAQIELGLVCYLQGEYFEAIPMLRTASASCEESALPTDREVAQLHLASALIASGRAAEANEICNRIAKNPSGSGQAEIMNVHGLALQELGQFEKAKTKHDQALVILQNQESEETFHEEIRTTLRIVELLLVNRRFGEALKFVNGILKRDKIPIPLEAAAGSLRAQCLHGLGQFSDALKSINAAIQLYQQIGLAPLVRSHNMEIRAAIHQSLRHQALALKDIETAIALADQQMMKASGTPYERAQMGRNFRRLFETAITLYVNQPDGVSRAFEIAELARSRTLQEQNSTSGIDLTTGISPGLQVLLAKASRRVVEVEQQLNRNENNDEAFEKNREKAFRELAEIESLIRDNSRRYRNAIIKPVDPPDLKKIDEWLPGPSTVILSYFIGEQSCYVFIARGGVDNRVVELNVSDQQANGLSIPSGALTAGSLARVLVGTPESVTSLLADRDKSARAIPALSSLWPVLIPESERNLIQNGTINRAYIIADGALAFLPFEALVTDSTKINKPEFLIDEDLVISYGLSVTSLASSKSKPIHPRSLFTIGIDKYKNVGAGVRKIVLSTTTGTSRQLSEEVFDNLSEAVQESDWVVQHARDADWSLKQWTNVEATEEAVRNGIADHELLHFSCHGFSLTEAGNAFGGLVLSLPESPSPVSLANNGFLTVSEIGTLRLDRCKLAILSACLTSDGPLVEGVGSWSLARSFIAAGCDRAVAELWRVDDEAASYRISHLVGALAAQSSCDYAEATHVAKRWVRDQEKWQAPYYWASSVLLEAP